MKSYRKKYNYIVWIMVLCNIFISNITNTIANVKSMPSVHEAFKDVNEAELLDMMKEGQQFIQYLEKNGTEEEKMAFAQAMEQTLQSFTAEDWEEFTKIVETVQDKLPPLIEPTPEPTKAETVTAEPAKPAITNPRPQIIIDNSLEKLINDINATINTILIKSKSDTILSERIAMRWENKEKFQEMVRCIMLLKQKEHLATLASSKDEAILMLVESLRNFNAKLQSENDLFIIADTFGLEIDAATSAANLIKLDKILQFFDTAIASLLPKLITFLQKYEPTALTLATNNEQLAKDALENSIKIEKQKKAPTPNYFERPTTKQKPSNTYLNNNNYAQGSAGHTTEQVPGFIANAHQNNLKKIPALNKNQISGKNNPKNEQNKSVPQSAYTQALDHAESYLEQYSHNDVNRYMATVNKVPTIYNHFGTPLTENDKLRAQQLQVTKSAVGELTEQDQLFLDSYTKRYDTARKNFAKNTQSAHDQYDQLAESIETIALQVDELQSVIHAIKSNLTNMSSKELEQIAKSSALKNIENRIESYHKQCKSAQKELRKKHQIYRIDELQNSYEITSYNDLKKAETIHGLDAKINQIRTQFQALLKNINTTIIHNRRAENKKASMQQEGSFSNSIENNSQIY